VLAGKKVAGDETVAGVAGARDVVPLAAPPVAALVVALALPVLNRRHPANVPES
jgi:hypothetical protein